MRIRRLIPSVVRWSIWPLRWSTGEDTPRVQTGGLWEYLWYITNTSLNIFEYICGVLFISFSTRLQFEMLTGTLPFQGKDRNETMNMILK